MFEKGYFSELLRLLCCIPLFVIIIIIIIIIMVVGWWCNAGVTRKREDPHNHFGGWWGQPANRNETGHNKTTGASRGSDYLTHFPRNTSSTSLPQQGPASHSAASTARAAGEGGEKMLMPVYLN